MWNYVNSWTGLAGWSVLMTVGWAFLVPNALSAASLATLAFTGPAVVIAGSIVGRAHAPQPSTRQPRASTDARNPAGRGTR